MVDIDVTVSGQSYYNAPDWDDYNVWDLTEIYYSYVWDLTGIYYSYVWDQVCDIYRYFLIRLFIHWLHLDNPTLNVVWEILYIWWINKPYLYPI